jgi:hypothetical protein
MTVQINRLPIYQRLASTRITFVHAIFRISMKLWRTLPDVDFPAALCRLDPTKYGLVNAAFALNLRAGSYINIF